jgi:nickel-dependent lactate racemase
MEIKIPYGQSHIPVQIPDHNLLGVYYPNAVETSSDETVVLQAIQQPLDCPSFPDFVRDAKDLLIIVNDATRPTPTAQVLKILHPQIKESKASFIIATGNHRGPTEEEFHFIFGDLYATYKDRIRHL